MVEIWVAVFMLFNPVSNAPDKLITKPFPTEKHCILAKKMTERNIKAKGVQPPIGKKFVFTCKKVSIEVK